VGASPALLRSLFGLTGAESALVLLLVEGLTLDEAAARQGVSRHTARSQLRSIFAKTGVTRQTELLRLVLRSVVPLG
jgi:DNA-binding CsgD family transcriptional regulator